MACFRPIEGFPRPGGGITWSPPQGYIDLPKMKVPCGQCIGCRLERGRQWTTRLMHEASLHREKCFITLTYDDQHLPKQGTLVKSHFQQFIQKVRDHYRGVKRISYFMCGEYGDLNWRPHYHAIIFGHDFGELVQIRFNSNWANAVRPSAHGGKATRSEELSRFWTHGLNSVGQVTAQSAGYVARYCLKKVTGVQADDHYRRIDADTGEVYWLLPEYAHMSTRPAIGKAWFDSFGSDVAAYDGVFHNGKRGSPPRYYDKLRKRANAASLKRAKRKRLFKALDRAGDSTPERLAVRQEIASARLKLFSKRKL